MGGIHHLDVTALCREGQWTVPKDVLTEVAAGWTIALEQKQKLWSYGAQGCLGEAKSVLFTVHIHSPEHARAVAKSARSSM